MGVFTNKSRIPTRTVSRASRPPITLVPAPHPGATAFTRPSPSPDTSRSLPYRAVRNMTAAASAINLQSPDEVQRLARRRQGDAWQAESWEYYDAIGEIKFAFGLVASVMSRVRLYAGENADPSQAPKPADQDSPGGAAAIAALQRLDSAFGGQPGLLRDAALNLCVPGECYLVQQPGNPVLGIPESWDIRSTDELQISNDGKIQLVTRGDGDSSSKKALPKNAFVARIWRPHPRFSDEADSSMRGLLDACAELLLLNKTFRATARSRLNAGLLYLPDGLSVSASPDPDAIPVDPEDAETGFLPTDTSDQADTDDFEESLIDAMTTPIADEESAAAVVPLLVRGPAEFADKVRLIQFERSFDPQLAQRADRVLDRIMQGIDVPKDVVTGLANVKYSNAVQIDESLYKSHIEPLALLICDALTVVYLRPSLAAAGVEPQDLHKYVVWYDASDVTTRPNRAEDAAQGYDKHLLNGEAWRREHGFSSEDAPDENEMALRYLLEKGSATPELAEALLSVFAPDVMARVREASQASNPAPLPPDVVEALGGAPEPPPGDEAPSPTADSAPTPAQERPAPGGSQPAPGGAAPAPAPIDTEDLV